MPRNGRSLPLNSVAVGVWVRIRFSVWFVSGVVKQTY